MTVSDDQCARIAEILGFPHVGASYDWKTEYATGKFTLSWREKFQAIKEILEE
jgi:hypothetical protein